MSDLVEVDVSKTTKPEVPIDLDDAPAQVHREVTATDATESVLINHSEKIDEVQDLPISSKVTQSEANEEAAASLQKLQHLHLSEDETPPALPPRRSSQIGLHESASIVHDEKAPAPPPKDWLEAPSQSYQDKTRERMEDNTTQLQRLGMTSMAASPSTSHKAVKPAHARSMSGSSILDGYEDATHEEKSEIQNIMTQFSSDTGTDDAQTENLQKEKSDTVESRPLPPRTSSLENFNNASANQSTPRSPITSRITSKQLAITSDVHSSQAQEAALQSPLPAPDPESPLPFDFHRFLEQLRHRTADPVAKFLRSFLQEFSKKQWQVHEQVKIINDFLTFIHDKMAQCEVWKDVSEDEFDNAKEGMEKLVMNRLYTQTFSPAIPLGQMSGSMSRRAKQRDRGVPVSLGRSGQHLEDTEKDDVLSQKAVIYGWVREEHLDIKPVGDSGRKFLSLAVQEILKIKNYRAPRDKVICVLNCCKVIFGLLRHSNSTQSADDFIPLLIYVVLQANPDHLVSNIQYITRFRNPDKLGGEAGYYLSSLSGAVQFIENLDRKSLTCDDSEFERNVEEAVRRIAEKKDPQSPTVVADKSQTRPRTSQETDVQRGATSMTHIDYTGEDENAAVAGLLRTIQKPLSTIGRIFSDEGGQTSQAALAAPMYDNRAGPASTPLPGNTPRGSPSLNMEVSHRNPLVQDTPAARHLGQQMPPRIYTAEESAARQASAETAEALNIQRAEHQNVVAILGSMFPDLDKDVIDDVVRLKEGRVGLAVDACLSLSAT